MTTSDSASSGELASFLHLTGWRPVILAFVAGAAGVVGAALALGEPAQWQASYLVDAGRLADDDLTPIAVDTWVDELVANAQFSEVIDHVEEVTGLEEETDYKITVNQANAATQIAINVVADTPEEAEQVAQETAIKVLDLNLNKTLESEQRSADRIQADLDIKETRITELTIEAGGVNPAVAYDVATGRVTERELQIARGDRVQNGTDITGAPIFVDAEDLEPSLEDLKTRLGDLEPIQREHEDLVTDTDALRLALAEREDSIREADSGLAVVAAERETPTVITNVVTEKASRLTSVLSSLFLFAVPAAIVLIVLFVLNDKIRHKPTPAPVAEPLPDSFGAIDGKTPDALPEATYGSLHAISEDSSEEVDEEVDDDFDDETEEEPSRGSKKASRWGRNADDEAV